MANNMLTQHRKISQARRKQSLPMFLKNTEKAEILVLSNVFTSKSRACPMFLEIYLIR